jgi:hypothetical protein
MKKRGRITISKESRANKRSAVYTNYTEEIDQLWLIDHDPDLTDQKDQRFRELKQ